MSVYLSIYTFISLSMTSHLISFLLGLAKLTGICAPRALINATSFFLKWAYPELAINPPNGEVADIAEVQITYKSEAANEDMVTEHFPSLNVTISGLLSDMMYTVTVHVVYSRPSLYGEDVILSIQTLPEGVSFICMYVCMYVCIYGCMYICMYKCMYLCISIFIYVHLCMTLYVSIYVYVCMYVRMYIYVYMCMYVH